MKKQILQKIADYIFNKLKESDNQKYQMFWYFVGIDFNNWCVEKEIYLE